MSNSFLISHCSEVHVPRSEGGCKERGGSCSSSRPEGQTSWVSLHVNVDQKEGGKRGGETRKLFLVWSRRMNNVGILVYECGIVSLLSSYPPSDLGTCTSEQGDRSTGTCTSEQGDRSTLTHKDAQVVHPSASHPPDLAICTSKQGDKSRLTHKDAQVVHPSASHPSDLAICTSKQGDKSTFTHKDPQVVHRYGPDEQQFPHLSPLSFHPPSDLGTCTSEQGERSTFIQKDYQIAHPSGPDEEQLPHLSPLSTLLLI